MRSIAPNGRIILQAINGPVGVYRIEKHDRLYLAVRGGGRASWRIRYRPQANANQRWYTLTDDARGIDFAKIVLKAEELLSDLKLRGIDPHATKARQAVDGRSLEAIFRQWLDHTGKRRNRALSPLTRKGYEELFARHIAKDLGSKPIDQIDRAAVMRTVERIKRATTDPKKGQRGVQATKVLKLLSSISEWCVDKDWIVRNPCRGIELPAPVNHPDGKQSRPPTNAELRQLWTEAPNVMTSAQLRVLRLAILLGRRISEIACAARDDVRLDHATPCLLIPAAREGNKPKKDDAVPLPRFSREIIEDAIANSSPGQPLFVGAATRWTTSKVLTTARRAWGWPDPPVRFHDFRGLINDQMAALGVPTELRSRTLHHTGDLRQLANTVYSAYDFMGERLRALELWEARLLEIVEDRPSSGLRW